MEKTLVILKPDAVARQLTGQIIARLENKGLKIVACKFMRIARKLAQQHYALHQGKPFYENLIDYITSGPVMVVALEAPGAIAMARKLMGKTFGCEAEPGTIRGDFGGSKGFNLIHGSDSPESAKIEIDLFFRNDQPIEYELDNAHWLYGKD